MRRILIPALLTLTAAAAGLTWLTASEDGLRVAARLAGEFSGGQLQIEGTSGSLAGPLAIERLRWQSPAREIIVSDLRLDWSPSALLHRQLAIAELAIGELKIVPGAPQPRTPPPESLTLPLAVDAEKIAISQITWGNSPLAQELSARLRSDGRIHRLEALKGRLADVDVTADATLDGAAPMSLDARADVRGRHEDRPLAAALTAKGPLAGFTLAAVAREGIEGNAQVKLTPFAETPFASARIVLENIDPAAWQAGAPTARIRIGAEVVPQGDGIIGSFALTNHRPGRIDAGRLPVESIAGQLAWQRGEHNNEIRLAPIFITLPGKGRLSGEIAAGQGDKGTSKARLELKAEAIDVSQIHSALRPTKLSGPISATLAGDRQQAKVDLRDAAWRLIADATRQGPQITLHQAELAAGDARISAKGEAKLDGERPFRLEGELTRLDPSRFARAPKALLNGSFSASGKLTAQRVVDARFALTDSRLGNQPLTGRGEVAIDGQRLAKADVHLAAGPNRVDTQGALGKPGDALEVAIDAPQLDGYGFDGGITGRFSLAGALPALRVTGRLDAPRFGLPGQFMLYGLALSADIAPQPTAPLAIDLKLDALDLPNQPVVAQALRLKVAGTQREHRLDLSAALAADTRLTLAATGGFDAKTGWQGRILDARLAGNKNDRNFRLTAPAPLAIAPDRWHVGPMALAGDPLDWKATLEASAAAGRLNARVTATGGRLGRIDGELAAGMAGPWALDRNAPWRGRLDGDMPDLGWLAGLAGKDWQSGGRLNAHLELAGTPELPRTSGRLQGERLAFRLPAQGMALTDGVLDIVLRENLLHINRLSFASLLQPMPRALRLAGGDELKQIAARPGRVEVAGEMRIDRDNRETAVLAIRLDRFGPFQTPDQWVALSGDGTLGWQAGTLTVRGNLTADAGYWQLAPVGQPQLSDDVVIRRRDEEKSQNNLRPKLDLELTANLGRYFLFNGAGLSSRLAGEVRLTASGRDLPRATGTIRARDGRFAAYGQQLAIERGILNFNGLLTNPGLDIRAVRKGLPVEAGVQIGGTAQKPVVRLVSDPELPDAEKLTWLILGHGPDQLGTGDAAVLLSAAGDLLGNNSGGVVRQIKQNFGLDEFGVRQGTLGDIGRPQTSRVAGGTYDTSGATGSQIFSVGKQLNSIARLSYEQALGKAESIVKLTVNLTRQISVVGRAGSDNALDIFYTLAFGRQDSAAPKPRKEKE